MVAGARPGGDARVVDADVVRVHPVGPPFSTKYRIEKRPVVAVGTSETVAVIYVESSGQPAHLIRVVDVEQQTREATDVRGRRPDVDAGTCRTDADLQPVGKMLPATVRVQNVTELPSRTVTTGLNS